MSYTEPPCAPPPGAIVSICRPAAGHDRQAPVLFTPQICPVDGSMWYECFEPGCRGAHLQSFPPTFPIIPLSVIAAMKDHVLECHSCLA